MSKKLKKKWTFSFAHNEGSLETIMSSDEMYYLEKEYKKIIEKWKCIYPNKEPPKDIKITKEMIKSGFQN